MRFSLAENDPNLLSYMIWEMRVPRRIWEEFIQFLLWGSIAWLRHEDKARRQGKCRTNGIWKSFTRTVEKMAKIKSDGNQSIDNEVFKGERHK